jgi:superfamily I DNA/RNA helicase/DNA polymerase III epsilon subunit-like protein
VITASPSQRSAIEAAPGPLLVLAGPGAGKTFCLIERIHHLINRHGYAPERICAFTFTRKAAAEITDRLEARLGESAAAVHGGTIHAFCANVLRKHPEQAGLEPGFGIADEEYQLGALRRIEGPSRWHKKALSRFSAHRLAGGRMMHDDLLLLAEYEAFLADFDTLVLKTAELLKMTEVAQSVRNSWDAVLVDEFQDLNTAQYSVVRALAVEHRHLFAVGDDEQSIFSWAGADRRVFDRFQADFSPQRVDLEDNRRTPQQVFDLARRLISRNPGLFDARKSVTPQRISPFAVQAFAFPDDESEVQWLIADLLRDHEAHGHAWGDVALLYRVHAIGERLEAALLSAGIPCALQRGHALSDDPAAAYVIAALRVVLQPRDDVNKERFFRAVLPRPILDEATAKAQENGITLLRQLQRNTDDLPRGDDSARQIRRALYDLRNLASAPKQHSTLASLVQELLSRRVGPVPSVLQDHHDELGDPLEVPEALALGQRLREARAQRRAVWVEPMGGVDIPLRGMLQRAGFRVRGRGPSGPTDERLQPGDATSLELPLVVFKALQLLEMDGFASSLTNFTALDAETTDRRSAVADIVELAALRVRDGRVVDTFESLVRPAAGVPAGATALHGISNADVATAPTFAELWPRLQAFCGNDVVVAHNGYEYDFAILGRKTRECGLTFSLSTFDTLPLARDLISGGARLEDLARRYGIERGRAHRAPDDARALVGVFLALGREKAKRARKTALVNLLDHVGVALALHGESRLSDEGRLVLRLARPFALGRYSDCLEYYERECTAASDAPSLDELISRLGGRAVMERIRAERSADERYPETMQRLRRLIADIPETSLNEQIQTFLERTALSAWDGAEPMRDRVNLLTLHATKGLEFSRVYIVGVEDELLPGGAPGKPPANEEVEEARRLLYVGMTRAEDRLVLTWSAARGERESGGHRFLDEMGVGVE